MFANDPGGENFEDALRSIAAELGQYLERSLENVDLDDISDRFGVDSSTAAEWAENAGGWLRALSSGLGEEIARRASGAGWSAPGPGWPVPGRKADPTDPLGTAGPHPLDQPTDEQGLALAALDSGRWIIEPGADALAAKGEGPGPSDALGIVRELRVRDWIAADGQLTLTGQRALSRWLEAAAR
ncbi:MAG TPA: hypothetical protein VME22_20360 [Solirubrobacteraceae bacterium]|nr:hypothetical protein [Solirubrobacteraceae bacterium]